MNQHQTWQFFDPGIHNANPQSHRIPIPEHEYYDLMEYNSSLLYHTQK